MRSRCRSAFAVLTWGCTGRTLIDVELSGGPVETLAFVIDLAAVQTATSLSTTAIVNGEEMEVRIGEEEFRR